MIRRPPRSTLFPTRRSSDLEPGRILLRLSARSGKNASSEIRTCGQHFDILCKPAYRGIASKPCEPRSEEHTSELQSHLNLVCRLLLEKKKSACFSLVAYCIA